MAANALSLRQPNRLINTNMAELLEVASLVFNSKIYGDIQTKEAAAIKIIAGKEYGFDPFQSMAMFDFIQGRPTLNAHGKATLINSSGDFRLRVKTLTAKECEIDVCRKNDRGEWKVVATRSFTLADAVQAELTTGKNAHSWKKYPRNMLFARCVSNIWRWDCAEINLRRFDPAEIQEFDPPAEMEADRGEVVDGEIVESDADRPDGARAVEAEPVSEDESDAPAGEAAEESNLIDLRTAVQDRIAEVTGGEASEIKKILKGRQVGQMGREALVSLLADLDAM